MKGNRDAGGFVLCRSGLSVSVSGRARREEKRVSRVCLVVVVELVREMANK
jgi:hypothetical protein